MMSTSPQSTVSTPRTGSRQRVGQRRASSADGVRVNKTPSLNIVRDHDEPRGRYQADVGDGLTAELTYFETGNIRVIDHTATPDALRGKGVAGALTARAVEDALAEGKKIHPACSYVAAWLRRHPEYNALVVDPATAE